MSPTTPPDLLLEVEIIDNGGPPCVRVFDDYFPITGYQVWDDMVMAMLPMENTCSLQLVVSSVLARAILVNQDEFACTVKEGVIVKSQMGDHFVEDVTCANDLWTWMRQLGRIAYSP